MAYTEMTNINKSEDFRIVLFTTSELEIFIFIQPKIYDFSRLIFLHIGRSHHYLHLIFFIMCYET
jgi:hypothetical protein